MIKECVFCKIVNGQIPSEILYENEALIAFRDINPQAPVHVLLVPKKHIPCLNDVQGDDNAIVTQLLNTAKVLAAQLGVSEAGYRVVINCGENAGQEVLHLHMHLLAGRPMSWPPG